MIKFFKEGDLWVLIDTENGTEQYPPAGSWIPRIRYGELTISSSISERFALIEAIEITEIGKERATEATYTDEAEFLKETAGFFSFNGELSVRLIEESGSITYIGKAATPLAEADDGWVLSKIEVIGSVTHFTSATGSWANRATLIYA